MIPGLGRYLGEGKGHPLQYSGLENSGLQRAGRDFRASLVAQLVKNPPEMWETWVQSLGWEDSLEKGMVTYSSILACGTPWTV